MSGCLEGRGIVITGGASGIGRSAALACAREGARVAVADVDARGSEDAACEIRDAGGTAVAVICDVTCSAEVDALFARASEVLGQVDGAFLNAGIEGRVASLDEYDEVTFRRVLEVNVIGVWNCLRVIVPQMTGRGRGSIVCTSSIAGLVGAGAFSAYVASKHAVLGLMKTAAIESARSGVRVNAICPGVIETPMLDRLAQAREGLVDALVGMKPMGRLGTAAEVAEAAVWLLSDRASFVTGHALVVDGGYVAQ
ncbi:MAG TPA: glucose 1-dehydrogenase [Candidatus Limnocylindrales bacterium]|nr:glucose 1-dehydrogenase [Candidatus Limnocylindrales bacterium]